ncbi:MAG: hypothetical protein ABI379_13450 [Rhodanobacter sp.]
MICVVLMDGGDRAAVAVGTEDDRLGGVEHHRVKTAAYQEQVRVIWRVLQDNRDEQTRDE